MTEQRSLFTDSGVLSMASTARFDQKLVNKLQYPVPSLRPTMVDHSIERLPMTSTGKKTITRKPVAYHDWGGAEGGAFYFPPQCSVTKGPTSFDTSVEMSPAINQVEQHFTNYFQSGEHSRFPDWTRTHWTADVAGPSAKNDNRAKAFYEVSAATVAPGPYWNGLGAAQRPSTGSVITNRTMARRSMHHSDTARGGGAGAQHSPGGGASGGAVAHHSDVATITATRRANQQNPFAVEKESAMIGGALSRSARGNVSGRQPWESPTTSSRQRYQEQQHHLGSAGSALGSARSRADEDKETPLTSRDPFPARHWKSARDYPVRSPVLTSSGRSARGAGGHAGSGSARGVGAKEASSWIKESGSWQERPWGGPL